MSVQMASVSSTLYTLIKDLATGASAVHFVAGTSGLKRNGKYDVASCGFQPIRIQVDMLGSKRSKKKVKITRL